MLKRIGIGVAMVLVALLAAAAVVAWRVSQIREVKLDDQLYAYLDGGGNSAVLLTDKGAVVVDTKMSLAAQNLLAAVQKLGAPSLRALINTHHHPDHTHGNPIFFSYGIPIYAAAPVARFLTRFDRDFWAEMPASRMVPNHLFEDETEIDFGADVVRLVQLPPGHTGGGDIGVLFVKRRVLHTGDAYTKGYYPNVDLRSGGSIAGMIAALDKLLALPFDTVIPGHGPMATRADLESGRAYVAALWDYARKAAAAKKTVAEAVEEAPAELRGLSNYPLLTSLEKNITWAMQKAAPK